MNTPLTDAEALAYIASYPDLRAALGPDAAAGRQHYEAFGQAEGRTIAFSGLLYTAANPDLIVALGTDTVAAIRHYIQYGADENRPTRFDALAYIASNPDLRQAFGADEAAGAEHYILYGLAEQRPTASFDAFGYTAANPDLLAAFGPDAHAATEHYIRYGASENRPMTFDALSYVAANADLIAALGTDTRAATDHYVRYGAAEHRPVTFGALEYIASNPDLITAFGTDTAAATRHYVQYGAAEGRPLAAFDPSAYLLSQPDLRAAGIGADGALLHWVNYGFAEGRNSGDATFGREQGDHTLAVGQTVASSIDAPGDHDWFRIDARQGQKIEIMLSLAEGAAEVPAVHIYDANGGELVAAVTERGAGSYGIVFTADDAGAVYVTTEGANGYQGDYMLSTSVFFDKTSLVKMVGDSFPNNLYGTDGNSSLQGLGGNDTLSGGPGNDVLEGGSGADSLRGGLGDDILFGNNATNSGFDYSPPSTFPYNGDSLSDRDGGNDQLYGQDGDDELEVFRFRGSASTLLLDGGSGNDSIRFESTRGALDNVTIFGGTGNDYITMGTAARRFIDAGDGNDRVDVTLSGGVQTITLGGGEDMLRIGIPADLINITGPTKVTDFLLGTDRLVLTESSFDYLSQVLIDWDRLSNPFRDGYLNLVQSGSDTLLQIDPDGSANGHKFTTLLIFENTVAASFTARDLGFAPDGSTAGGTVIGTSGADELVGTYGNDVLRGLEGDDRLYGLNGNDILEGGPGTDSIHGGLGDDVLYGNNAANIGADGRDYLRDESGGNDKLFGQDGNDFILVTRYSYAPASTVLMDGGSGDDYLEFGSLLHNTAVEIIGGPGSDFIQIGGVLKSAIDAGDGDDQVHLLHSGGDQTITLGLGADLLVLEQFFGVPAAGSTIHVTDFLVGTDRLALSAYVELTLNGWNGINPFATCHLKLVQSGSDTLLQIDQDGSANGASYATLITFDNTTAASFTARELGYAPDGSAGGQGASGELTEVLGDLYAGSADAALRPLWDDGSGAFGGMTGGGLGLLHAEVLL